MPKFLIQTHKFSGYYNNPFKSGGQGVKFTPWKTVEAFDDQQAAEARWEELHAQRNAGLLERFRIMHEGKIVVNDRGAVYETVMNDDGGYRHCSKTLKGYEL